MRRLARPLTATQGGLVGFAVVVTNRGPSDARDVVVTDTLPDGLELMGARAPTGSCEGLRCELGTIRAGGSKQILIVARVTRGAGTLVNTVHADGSTPDPDPTNNDDAAPVWVDGQRSPPVRLFVTKTASQSVVRVGQPFAYRVRVRNEDARSAPAVLLVDTNTLPMRVLSVRSSQGTCKRRDRVTTCRLGELRAGALATVRMRVVILRAGRSLNVAAVPGAGGDRSDVAAVTARGGAALRIRKMGRRSVRLGHTIAYRIRVRSLGPDPAQRLRVCDWLPRELRLIGGGPSVCHRLPGLAAGDSHTFRVTARAIPATPRARNRTFAEVANARRAWAERSVRVLDTCGRVPRRPGFAGSSLL